MAARSLSLGLLVNVRDYTVLLRKHWRLITLCTLLCIAAATAATLLATPVYSAHLQMFVAAQDQATGTALQGDLFSQQRVKSYAQIVDSPEVTTAVIKTLGLKETPRDLSSKVSASAPTDTVLINVTVS